MSHESIKALERICTHYERQPKLSERHLRIYDIAMEGLGMVSVQRRMIIQPYIDRNRAEIQARRDRIMARQARIGHPNAGSASHEA